MDFVKLLLVALCFVVRHYPVEGGWWSISKEEDAEFERQLKSLNKPPFKTLQTEEGDIIDCIDTHRQPALDHPLLKNHKIQIRPTSLPKELIDENSRVDKSSRSMIRSIGCPQGTVPIPRTRKEDLIRAKSLLKSFGANIHPQSTPHIGEHLANLRSKNDPTNAYLGVGAYMKVNNPTVVETQTSSALIWIENGPDNELNSLQAGWMVAPIIYGDNKTRSFAYWTADNEFKKGCFNLLCSGFIEVDNQHFIGDQISPVSVNDGPQYEIRMLIFKDVATSNWWLTIGREPDLEKDIAVGYWPKEILPHLGGSASSVAWGGRATSPPNVVSPPMGNGQFPSHHYDNACRFKQLKVVNTSFHLENPQASRLETFAEEGCYALAYVGFEDDLGHTFWVGGPGGDNCVA